MEKYIWTERVTAVEQRFREDYAEGEQVDGKFIPKTVSTGWWLTFENNSSLCIIQKPEDEEGNLTIRPGDRMKFTMEKTS